MPGGHLTFFVYQKLGGEREFVAFWKELGLPVLLLVALAYLLVDRAFNKSSWMVGSLGFVGAMAVAVGSRVVL